MSKKEKIFSVIDIETTGGLTKRDRITEVGIVTLQGGKIIDEYSSLVHPERSIPYHITRITGIDGAMVAEAPKFYEIAREIVERTQSTIFVAHNVQFDYGFIQQEYRRYGYSYSRRKLCTRNLSRKLIPGLKSYSLKYLTEHFGIPLLRHHRALDDARAAAEILMRLMKLQGLEEATHHFINRGVQESRLPASITIEDLHALPEGAGVYYFKDRSGDIVYIGKSKHIQKRVMEHFAKTGRKAVKLQEAVHSMDYICTGNELHAMLLESAEIKKYLPAINKAQRTHHYPWQVVFMRDESMHYFALAVERKSTSEGHHHYVRSFKTIAQARSYIRWVTEELQLCLAVCGISDMGTPCEYYHLNKCLGACVMEEPPEDYNARAIRVLELGPQWPADNFIIIDEARDPADHAITLILDNSYYGHGTIDKNQPLTDIEDILEHLTPAVPSDEIHRIIQTYLNTTSGYDIVIL